MPGMPLYTVLNHLRRLHCADAAGRTDRELLRAFAAHNDQDAFAAVLTRHAALVWGVCRRILGHHQDAEDAFQATFLILARRAGSARWQASVGGYLYTVAQRLAVRARQRREQRRSHERQASRTPRVESSLRELAAVVDEELRHLPAKYRDPLLLHYLEGATAEAAALQLGLSRAAFYNRLARARELLRGRLSRQGLSLAAPLLASALTQEVEAAAPSLIQAVLRGLTGTVPQGVASLAAEALRNALLTKLKLGLALGLLLSVATGGVALWTPGPMSPHPQAERPVEPPRTDDKAARRVDRYGDPLPPGAIARLGTARFRHEGKAHSLVFSPNGKILAALTAGGCILWDARTGKEIQRVPDMRGSLSISRLCDFSPDGRMLAGPCDNNQIGLWDAATGKQLHTFAARQNGGIAGWCQIHTVRFSPDGKFLAIGGDGGGSYVLDVATGKALHHFKDESVHYLAFSPDGKMLAMEVAEFANRKLKATEIQLREVRTNKILRRWQGHGSSYACDLAFSVDGKMLALGDMDRITIWDAETGKVRTRIEKKIGQIRNLAFTPDGKTLFSGSEGDGKVRVWDVATGEERRQFDSHLGILQSMALSADGKTIAAGGLYSTIRLWDVASGRELFPDPPGHSASVNAVAFSPDGKLLISAGENRQAWLWDSATGNPVRQLRVPSAQSVAFSPDGQHFALLSPGKYDSSRDILVCDVASGKELFRVPPSDVRWVNAVAYSPNGKTLVSAGWKTTGQNKGLCNLNVYDASTGKFLRRFSIAMLGPQCLAFSPDGRELAIGGGWVPDSIRLWDPVRGEEIIGLRGHESHVTSLAFSPDGRTLVSGGDDRTVRLWEVATGKEIAALKGHEQEVATVAFSPDGRIVASGGVHPVYGGGTHENEIRLWDAATGEEVQHFRGHNSGVTSLAFSPDGTRLASGLGNGIVLLWEVPRGRLRIRQLSPGERKALWSDLADEDARRAYAAIRKLIEDPERTIGFLRDRLRPAPRTDPERIRQLIVDLDSEEYAVRQVAMKELAALGELAGPLLRERLAANPPLEVRKRVEELLSQTKVLHAGEVVRGVRAVEALEHIGTSDAREVLESLAKGAPEARLTREAKASLERLAKRRAAP